MATIYLMKQTNFSAESFQQTVENLGLMDKLQRSEKIVLKPNLTTAQKDDHHKGVTTPLWIMELVIEGVRGINGHAKILVVESDCGKENRARDKFVNHGMQTLVEKDRNLELYNLSENPISTFDFQGSYFRRKIEMPSLFGEEIFFISLAKAKTHQLTVFSGILKNQFGCLPMSDKTSYHPYISKVLADVNAFILPSLSILEVCPGMEGSGPLHGQDRDLGIISLSDNPVELDAFFIAALGLSRYQPPYITQSREQLRPFYPMEPLRVFHKDLLEGIVPFLYIPKRKRKKIQAGLLVQKFGLLIERVGKRLQRK